MEILHISPLFSILIDICYTHPPTNAWPEQAQAPPRPHRRACSPRSGAGQLGQRPGTQAFSVARPASPESWLPWQFCAQYALKKTSLSSMPWDATSVGEPPIDRPTTVPARLLPTALVNAGVIHIGHRTGRHRQSGRAYQGPLRPWVAPRPPTRFDSANRLKNAVGAHPHPLADVRVGRTARLNSTISASRSGAVMKGVPAGGK